MKDILLTEEGITKLREELKRLIEVDRKEVIKKLKEAREFGDLSENAEYDAARDQQSVIEGRIEELEAILSKARIIDTRAAAASGKIVIGAKIQVEVEGEQEDYQLVSSAESDIASGKVSIESPLGQALLNKKVGDVAEVAIPDGGSITYKILKVS